MIPDDAGFKTGGWDMNKYRQHARDDDIAMRNAEERTYPVIPDEAVEVLARILANEELFRAECEGYGWDAEKDSSDPFMPRARKEAKRYLEAAAPHLMAKGWDEGAVAGGEHQHHIEKAKQAGVEAPGNIFNPYRVQP